LNPSRWVNDANKVLLTDLYELTMLQSYFDLGMKATAVFDLFVRRLPPTRNYLVACGLEHVLEYLETLSFTTESLSYLRSLQRFSDGFLDSLSSFRFTGDVYAVQEGTVVFANEPLVEIVAPLPEAQFVETFVMNQMHVSMAAASKASRVVRAAKGRSVVDYGLRRLAGADAGIKAARAFYIAGVDGTSNVLAGSLYGIPVAGTMAHSYIQTFDNELDAFRHFVRSYPAGTLLIDTYDTLNGARHVIQLANELGTEFQVESVRLDSGDLKSLSQAVRRLLDEAGLSHVKIFASSSLDEYAIEALLAGNAPIDGFGVGVRMGTSDDAPHLDTVYKLVEYDGKPRMKLATDKATLPGRKQVFRNDAGFDVIASAGEALEGDPLLVKVMESGRRVAPSASLEECRARHRGQVEKLPNELTGTARASFPYPVRLSSSLEDALIKLRSELSLRV